MTNAALPFLIPITVIIGAFAVGIAAMVLRSQAKDRQHRERMFMAEKGIEIPPQLYDVPEAKPRNGLRAGRAWLMVLGAICVFVGIGVMIALGVREGMSQGINGIIPFFIGLGFLAAERMVAKFVEKGARE